MERDDRERFLNIDLNLLHSFIAVIDSGSNKAASELLKKDASGISRDIAKLAQQLDVPPLFTKKGKFGSLPTAHALALSHPAREALNILEAAFSKGGKFDFRASEHIFRIALSDHADLLLMPKISDYCSRRAPYISFETYNINTFEKNDEAYNDLFSGAIDLIIYDNIASLPQISSRLVARDKWIWVTNSNSRISDINDTDEDVVFVISTEAKDQFSQIERIRNRGPYITCATVMKVLNHIANIDNSVGCIPASIADIYLEALDLKVLTGESDMPDTAICMFWREGMDGSPERQWLLNAVEVATEAELQEN